MNSKKEVENIIKFIRDYYKENHLKGVIIGISGGKDSAVVAALFVKALGKENVIGLTLPCHSNETDKKDAQILSTHFGFPLYNFDLTQSFDTFQQNIPKELLNPKITLKNSTINLKPRLRMASLYYFAALFTELKQAPYIVAGTSNKSELYVGYFTKGGDSVHDISVLANFTKEEVIALGEVLDVPKHILYKDPSDGLSNQTDEQKLGVTYQNISDYLNNQPLEKEITQKIKTLHNQNTHKFKIPTYQRKEN